MNTQEFISDIRSTYNKGIAMIEKKNADYANSNDPFKNFKLFEFIFKDIDLSKVDKTELAIMMRILDKIQRMCNLLACGPKVVEESFDDTCTDGINYLGILKTYRSIPKAEKLKVKFVPHTNLPIPNCSCPDCEEARNSRYNATK